MLKRVRSGINTECCYHFKFIFTFLQILPSATLVFVAMVLQLVLVIRLMITSKDLEVQTGGSHMSCYSWEHATYAHLI